jgi:hypothetical protein
VAFSLKKTPHCSIQKLHRNWRTAVGTPPLGNGAVEYPAQGIFFPRLCKFFPAQAVDEKL